MTPADRDPRESHQRGDFFLELDRRSYFDGEWGLHVEDRERKAIELITHREDVLRGQEWFEKKAKKLYEKEGLDPARYEEDELVIVESKDRRGGNWQRGIVMIVGRAGEEREVIDLLHSMVNSKECGYDYDPSPYLMDEKRVFTQKQSEFIMRLIDEESEVGDIYLWYGG